jgi:CO dehydrogenase/acetyl-CoA synthase beta subunit
LKYNEIKKILEKFLKEVKEAGEKIQNHEIKVINPDLLTLYNIKVQIDKYKDIVLNSDMGLELGGMNKTSFSLIYPLNSRRDINYTNRITIIGPEINELNSDQINFGLFILLNTKNLSQELYKNVRNFSLISNGIEGFAIRSVPGRFWCRINQETINKKFSFQFLGKAILTLYKEKFGKALSSIEIILIVESSKFINRFLEYTIELRNELTNYWKDKVDNRCVSSNYQLYPSNN